MQPEGQDVKVFIPNKKRSAQQKSILPFNDLEQKQLARDPKEKLSGKIEKVAQDTETSNNNELQSQSNMTSELNYFNVRFYQAKIFRNESDQPEEVTEESYDSGESIVTSRQDDENEDQDQEMEQDCDSRFNFMDADDRLNQKFQHIPMTFKRNMSI